jgi:Tol biopolymer transport system component
MSAELSRRNFLKQAAIGAYGASFPDLFQRRKNPLLGYSEYRTNLPGGRHPNGATTQACIIGIDGSGRRELAPDLGKKPDTWTQFAGWSPDGRCAIIGSGWEDPKNAEWEEEHKTFRMTEGWLLDILLLELATGRRKNLSAVDRVSRYNTGLFYWPKDPKRLGFEALVNGVSHPFSMDLDGKNKRDLSEGGEGFTYGTNASPDGSRIAYHKDYQIYLANADGSQPTHVETGNPFNFCPRWSPDGDWLLFVSGEHENCHPHVVDREGKNLRKIGDRQGYKGWVTVLDVPDYHNGSSDVPVWSPDGKWIYYTSLIDSSVEIMRASLDGKSERLTHSHHSGTLHYHLQPRKDGKFLAFGSNKTGLRQIHAMRVGEWRSWQVTHVGSGWGAMWAYWRPV